MRVGDGPVATLGGLPLEPYDHLCAFYEERLVVCEVKTRSSRRG